MGVLNPNLRVFDIVMTTEYGTSYNSYLVKGEKTALIETCHLSFFDEYVEHISQVCDPKEIDYIILNHTEPDHSGALDRLLGLCPKAQILCSKAASIYLRGITNRDDLNLRVVADGDKLDLGGKTLTFISAPFLHWPDSIFTWLEEDKLLFSCDFLGCHYCEPRMIDRYITYPTKYEAALAYYYTGIMGPFPAYVRAGLEKIKALDVEMACTSHGPVLTRGGRLEYALEQYAQWSRPAESGPKVIPLFYCTAYGNTRDMAARIKAGILEVIPDAVVELFDLVDHDMGEMAAKLAASDAFLLGSPTINRDAVPPIWVLLSHIDAINSQKKPCAVFGSYGWSGEAVPAICQRLTTLRLKVFGEGLKVNFVPSKAELDRCHEFGIEFAGSLLG